MSFNEGMEGVGKAEGMSCKSQFKHCLVSELQANSFENNRNCGYQSSWDPGAQRTLQAGQCHSFL